MAQFLQIKQRRGLKQEAADSSGAAAAGAAEDEEGAVSAPVERMGQVAAQSFSHFLSSDTIKDAHRSRKFFKIIIVECYAVSFVSDKVFIDIFLLLAYFFLSFNHIPYGILHW